MLVSYDVYDTCTSEIYFCWFSHLHLKPARTAQFDGDKGKRDNVCDICGFLVFIFCLQIVKN